jgi:glutamate--glyoxylate aminotransferase
MMGCEDNTRYRFSIFIHSPLHPSPLQCVRMVMNLAISGPKDGIMVPIPQYPLYSASIALYGGQLVGYYLNEDDTWALDISALEESLAEARARGVTVKAMVFINPVSGGEL